MQPLPQAQAATYPFFRTCAMSPTDYMLNGRICAADDVARTTSTFNNSIASILFYCAGITRDGRLASITNNDWDDVLDVNLKGTFLMCQEFCEPTRLGKLLERKGSSRGSGGSIINIGSVVSNYGNIGQVNYAASKGGVVGLTRSIAKEIQCFMKDCIQIRQWRNHHIPLFPVPLFSLPALLQQSY